MEKDDEDIIEYIPIIELYKNPFKYLHIPYDNIFDKSPTGYSTYNYQIYHKFCDKTCKGKNVLGLSYLQLNHVNPYHEFIYFSQTDHYFNIITALYLPEDFFPILISMFYVEHKEVIIKNYIVKNPKIPNMNDKPITWENILSKNEIYNHEKLLENQTSLEAILNNRNSILNNGNVMINNWESLINDKKVGNNKVTHHYNSPEIYMNGKRYIRVEPFKPYFLNKLFDGIMGIYYHKPIDMYIEFISNFRNTITYQIPLSNISDDIYFHDVGLNSELDENILKNKLCVNEKVCQEVDSMWYYNYIEENIEKINLLENRKILG